MCSHHCSILVHRLVLSSMTQWLHWGYYTKYPEAVHALGTANGQDIGVKGSIMVSFKIGPCCFTHKFIMCEGITRPFILGEGFLSHHCFKLGWTDNNKTFAKYRSEVIAVASQAVMDDRTMVSHPVRIPARHFSMVPTKCPNIFSGRVEVHPCPEFRSKFPNLYMEPM